MRHWIKFNIIGLLGFALQSGALFLLTHNVRPIGYLAATALAVELAVLNNFAWHQRWTWSDRPTANSKETWRRLAKFNLTTGLVSLAGNLVLMSILVGRMGLPVAGANVVTVAGCSVLSFFLADRIAFEGKANC
jgi:putative flippase GtrA